MEWRARGQSVRISESIGVGGVRSGMEEQEGRTTEQTTMNQTTTLKTSARRSASARS